jgi:uncharacterized ion transporter superfamily protein YfcC
MKLRNLTIGLVVIFLLFALVFFASCGKKKVKTDPTEKINQQELNRGYAATKQGQDTEPDLSAPKLSKKKSLLVEFTTNPVMMIFSIILVMIVVKIYQSSRKTTHEPNSS